VPLATTQACQSSLFGVGLISYRLQCQLLGGTFWYFCQCGWAWAGEATTMVRPAAGRQGTKVARQQSRPGRRSAPRCGHGDGPANRKPPSPAPDPPIDHPRNIDPPGCLHGVQPTPRNQVGMLVVGAAHHPLHHRVVMTLHVRKSAECVVNVSSVERCAANVNLGPISGVQRAASTVSSLANSVSMEIAPPRVTRE
jgi:hypothetical protein